jgi:hypothetical protein
MKGSERQTGVEVEVVGRGVSRKASGGLKANPRRARLKPFAISPQ